MNDYVASLIRTNVPILVSALVTWLASIGVVLPEDASAQLAVFVGALAGAVYYAAVRYLERKFPWVGKLLGTAAAPVYVAAKDVTPENADTVASDVLNRVEDLYKTKSLAA